jgi:uracil-DNA glycosylase
LSTQLQNAKQLLYLQRLKALGYTYHTLDIKKSVQKAHTYVSSFEELNHLVNDCQLCSLSKSRSCVVFGEGDSHAKVMFVGDAPGAKEDELGRPFVGSSGELLTQMIEKAIGISRQEVYVTNIVKCKPQGSNRPDKEEREKCLHFLEQQIAFIQPKLLVLLGEMSFETITQNREPLNKVRGKLFEYKEVTVLPTYHPSYLLRNPSAKKEAYSDMLYIKQLLETL